MKINIYFWFTSVEINSQRIRRGFAMLSDSTEAALRLQFELIRSGVAVKADKLWERHYSQVILITTYLHKPQGSPHCFRHMLLCRHQVSHGLRHGGQTEVHFSSHLCPQNSISPHLAFEQLICMRPWNTRNITYNYLRYSKCWLRRQSVWQMD